MTETRERGVGPWRREVGAFLELFALAGIAIAQPTFDILGKDATGVVVSRHASALQVVTFTVLLILIPPLVGWVIEVLFGAVVPRIRPVVHALLCGLAIGVLAVEVLKHQTTLTSGKLIGLGVVAGLAGAALVLRFATVKLWLRYLALAPVVFAVLFVFFSPITDVVFHDAPTAASGVTIKRPTRVVLVVMDELALESLLDGTGHIDKELYPNFAKLAGTSTWYRNDTTVAHDTPQAVPAILTGNLPIHPTNPPVASEFPNNLFTLLGGAYDMNVHEPYTRLCPPSICKKSTSGAIHGGVRGLFDDAWRAWREFASPEPTQASLPTAHGSLSSKDAMQKGADFVASLHRGSNTQLDFLHVILPHYPWHYLQSGQEYGHNTWGAPPGLGGANYTWRDDFAGSWARQRHLLQVQAADRLLGDIIRKLKAVGAWNDSLVILTADHGVAFSGGSAMRASSRSNYPQLMWTPLFIKTPGEKVGTIDDRPVRSVDIVPTIVDYLGVKLPWKSDGQTVRAPARSEGLLPLLATGPDLVHPADGGEFNHFDGTTGFAEVLASSATRWGGDLKLRLFRTGPYGAMVGRRASSFAAGSANATTGTLDNATDYEHVHRNAHQTPWIDARGSVVARERRAIAVTVNGVVGAVTETTGQLSGGRTVVSAVLPPSLFRNGKNEIGFALVDGDPSAPHLTPVRMSR